MHAAAHPHAVAAGGPPARAPARRGAPPAAQQRAPRATAAPCPGLVARGPRAAAAAAAARRRAARPTAALASDDDEDDDDDDDTDFGDDDEFDDDDALSFAAGKLSGAGLAPGGGDGMPVEDWWAANLQGERGEAEDAAPAPAAGGARDDYAALLEALPGLRRRAAARAARADEAAAAAADGLPRTSVPRTLRRAEAEMSAWDLRAVVEERDRRARARAAWLAARAAARGRAGLAADWRADARVRDTGDPTQPGYREWTHREIWDMIRMGGLAADPRGVPVRVGPPGGGEADPAAEGHVPQPEWPEWMAERGLLVDGDAPPGGADGAAETLLLAAEFAGLDDDYLAAPAEGGSFDERP